MQKLLQDIVPILFGKEKGEKREHLIDNFVFRLHYRVTTAGLVAAAVLVSIQVFTTISLLSSSSFDPVISDDSLYSIPEMSHYFHSFTNTS